MNEFVSVSKNVFALACRVGEAIDAIGGLGRLVLRHYDLRIKMRFVRRQGMAAGIILTLAGACSAGLAGTAAPTAAVAGFAYRDTSGEERDQTAAHAAFLKGFAENLRGRLGATFRIVPVECAESCPSVEADAGALLGYARRAGTDYLVTGGFHKMSTLVQWAKITVSDVRTGKPVYDRLFTFRGDNENAWKRAADFIARQLAGLENMQ